MYSVIWCHIFIELSDDLHLVDNMLRWISNNEIFSSKNFFSVPFNPREKRFLCDSVLLIDFDQATQSGLENITVVIIHSPLIQNMIELPKVKLSGIGAVKWLIVDEVCSTEDCKSDWEYLWLGVLTVVNIWCLNEWHVFRGQISRLVLYKLLIVVNLFWPWEKVGDFHESFLVEENILRSYVTDSGEVSCLHLFLGIQKTKEQEPELSFIESFLFSSAIFDLLQHQIGVIIIADLKTKTKNTRTDPELPQNSLD